MKVFLLKDVENLGKAGQIVKVTDGYAVNFLVPRKLAIVVTEANATLLQNKLKKIEEKKEETAAKTSELADKISKLSLNVSKKTQEGGKLYGSITPAEIVDLLKQEGISVAKNQVILDKAIKSKGSYEVTVKLSSQLQPKFTLKVIEGNEAAIK